MSLLIQLQEHQDSDQIRLSLTERDRIAELMPRATISPVPGTTDTYVINPRDYVGLISTGQHTIHIAPKIGIRRALFLISYALNPKDWRDDIVDTTDEMLINEAIAIPFIRHVRNAVKRHVLHGYRTTDDSLHGIRGRLRFSDQLRRHQRLTVPVEVSYDEYSPDIIENQILLAALVKLRRLRRLPVEIQHDISRLAHALSDVTQLEFHPRQVPNVPITRLNRHYAPALALGRLMLRNRTIELAPGAASSKSLLFDMAAVFETFVHTALREALRLAPHEFPPSDDRRVIRLDRAGSIRLRPDITWWAQGACALVGDIKYKRTETGDGKHADLYQLLAYTHATQLDNGTLIYAHTESATATHTTIGGTTLHIEALHLHGEPTEILGEIDQIAQRLRERRARSAADAA